MAPRALERVSSIVAHVVPKSTPEPVLRAASVAGQRALRPAPTSLDGAPLVLMLDAPAEEAVERWEAEEMFEAHGLRVCWASDAAQMPQDASVLVTVKSRVAPDTLKRLPNLRFVAVAFTGYDHVDLEECRRRGITVANVPGYSTDGVAELVFGLIFALLRHIPTAHAHMRAGKWAWPAGNELSNKRIGIIGTGKIGMRVAEVAFAFRVGKVLAWSKARKPKLEAMGIEYVPSLASLFLNSDIVVVAVSLTKETRGLVNANLLRLLQPDSLLINTARGPIVDEAAMVEMLCQGRFRAGIDVYEQEPLPADHPLRRVPEGQLVTLPHVAYKCEESLHRRQDVTLANILAFLAESPQNIVS